MPNKQTRQGRAKPPQTNPKGKPFCPPDFFSSLLDAAARYADKAASTPGAHYLIAMIALAANSLAGRSNQASRWKQEVLRRSAKASAAHYFAAFPTRDTASRNRIAAVLAQHGF